MTPREVRVVPVDGHDRARSPKMPDPSSDRRTRGLFVCLTCRRTKKDHVTPLSP
jgi:hypothetical protein